MYKLNLFNIRSNQLSNRPNQLCILSLATELYQYYHRFIAALYLFTKQSLLNNLACCYFVLKKMQASQIFDWRWIFVKALLFILFFVTGLTYLQFINIKSLYMVILTNKMGAKYKQGKENVSATCKKKKVIIYNSVLTKISFCLNPLK